MGRCLSWLRIRMGEGVILWAECGFLSIGGELRFSLALMR